VQQMMAEYMNQGDIGIFVRSYPKMKANWLVGFDGDDDDEGDFDVLGDDDEDD
jgi:hypothetical protein